MKTISHSSLDAPFFGREQDIQTILTYLHNPTCRLITILGAGGIGKTRLAQEIADKATPLFTSIYFVSLQGITSKQSFITQLVRTLNIQIFDTLPIMEQISNWLEDQNVLVILDNFEQLLNAKHIIKDLIRETSYSRFLITSRQTLNLQLEHVHHLRGLAYRDGVTSAAVGMFSSYAQRAHSSFNLSIELDDVITICQLVDGMPLALQLASAWVKVLSCKDIANEIRANYATLNTDYDDLPDRHQSMESCFDYSWQMLTPKEQTLFAFLSLFRGGWTLQASKHIADADIETLRSLTEKSFIQFDTISQRYAIHELLRQYGYAKLSLNQDEKDTAQLRYMSYYAEQALEHTMGLMRNSEVSHHFFLTEINNIHHIWHLSIQSHQQQFIEMLWEGLYLHHMPLSHYREALDLYNILYDHDGFDESIRHIAITMTGWFALRIGQIEWAISRLEEGFDDDVDVTLLDKKAYYLHRIHYTSALIISTQYDRALQQIESIMDDIRKLNISYFEAFALYMYGRVANGLKQYQKAEYYLNQSIEISQDIGLDWGTGLSLIELSSVLESNEQYKKALKALDDSYRMLKNANDYWGMVFSLSYASRILLQQNRLHHAQHTLKQAFEIALASENISAILSIIVNTATYLVHLNQPQQALKLAYFVGEHKATYSQEREQAHALCEDLTSRQSKKDYKRAVEESKRLTNQQAIDLVKSSLSLSLLPKQLHPLDQLTPREMEVLQKISLLLSTDEIAKSLSITKGTLRNHKKQVYKKLGAHSRLEAVTVARELGLL